MKGRKRIPSKIIILRGGTRHTHQPLREGVPEPVAERLPPCPKHIDRHAHKQWRRVTRVFGATRVYTAADLTVLARYCESVSQWVQLNAELAAIHDSAGTAHLTHRVQQYRIEYARWDKARIEAAKGLIGINMKTGKPIPNPWVRAEREAHAAMTAIMRRIETERRDVKDRMAKDESELALTPVSRERLSIESPKPMGKVAQFMERKNGAQG